MVGADEVETFKMWVVSKKKENARQGQRNMTENNF